jgi:hypothetical protein
LTEFPSLQELVQRELARRQESEDMFPALSFVVDDEHSATDVETAVKAIVERPATRLPSVSTSAAANVTPSSRPCGRFTRTGSFSPGRHAERPGLPSQVDEQADAAVLRAQERAAKLREGR